MNAPRPFDFDDRGNLRSWLPPLPQALVKRMSEANARANAAMTPKERRASEAIKARLAAKTKGGAS